MDPDDSRTPTEAGAPYSASWPPCAITASAGSAAANTATVSNPYASGRKLKPRPQQQQQQQPTSSSIPPYSPHQTMPAIQTEVTTAPSDRGRGRGITRTPKKFLRTRPLAYDTPRRKES
ncbi:hypothetical protein THAOC_04906 [Thalassiosira oceanica]|uniref:Uncharacterized protein n=1 Tax=Thalassiosira oceanica TaxID=159749 RepID=K0T8N0_THAOC|nr:hypothetical protein THAOC_04906 [Thalassiosira oceanica]|eukprot:EJK73469.1 hypothetical protein THAOC_04906 [Thalassiosira oceanica]